MEVGVLEGRGRNIEWGRQRFGYSCDLYRRLQWDGRIEADFFRNRAQAGTERAFVMTGA